MGVLKNQIPASEIYVPGPSCDALGRITYTPTVKGYRPATESLLGLRCDLITCLNTSEVMRIKRNRRIAKQLITRVYSLKSNGKSGKLLGHASRFVLRDVTPVLWAEGRAEVLAKHSITPHAWLRGTLVELLSNDDFERHHALTREFSEGYNIAYNPYLDSKFRCLKNQKYITDLNQGAEFMSAKEVYCFEDGIVAK